MFDPDLRQLDYKVNPILTSRIWRVLVRGGRRPPIHPPRPGDDGAAMSSVTKVRVNSFETLPHRIY